ncbi:hypothetical protein [Tsuneonella mangrovi]|uniref:hypothetical protein n=1 Tax=Tsuneonella mangrovi TaxID=1982042 RepID=UPI000BA20D0E|nr:hypothetical protein [Tsuneonella mangrovi]
MSQLVKGLVWAAALLGWALASRSLGVADHTADAVFYVLLALFVVHLGRGRCQAASRGGA